LQNSLLDISRVKRVLKLDKSVFTWIRDDRCARLQCVLTVVAVTILGPVIVPIKTGIIQGINEIPNKKTDRVFRNHIPNIQRKNQETS